MVFFLCIKSKTFQKHLKYPILMPKNICLWLNSFDHHHCLSSDEDLWQSLKTLRGRLLPPSGGAPVMQPRVSVTVGPQIGWLG